MTKEFNTNLTNTSRWTNPNEIHGITPPDTDAIAYLQHVQDPKTIKDLIDGAPMVGTPTIKGVGLKFDQGKAPMSLLSREALEQTALVLEFGRKKYAAHNWRKGFEWSRPLSAAMRHLTAFIDGEDKDPESGLSHMAHLACCVMFILEFEKTHKELDDRYKSSTGN